MAIFILVNYFISRLIIQINYQINSRELGLKTVLGYSLMEKIRLSLIISLSFIGMAILTVFISSLLMDRLDILSLILVLLILVLTDLLATYSSIRQNDKVLISKILKGGL